IKSEMINLADSFLLSDLGFNEKNVHLVFSGGRGYHAHIPSEEVITLGTHERRELVDYITCSGLNIDWVFPFQRVVTSQQRTAAGNRSNIAKDRLIPPPEAGGWRRRMRGGLMDLVNDVCDLDPKVLRKAYPTIAGTALSTLTKMQDDVRSSRKVLFEKNTMATLNRNTQETLVKIMENDVAPSLSAEIDKPVTPDIKRIIRLPGSVHGKTGLRVTPITRQQLTDFDPLEDAVPSSYSDESVKITLKKPYEFKMLGQHFSLSGETEVPEFAAVFLVGRKAADFGYASEKKESLF
ncbi:MAG: DNA primase catalytic subunit PriS, partial [Methanomassiliicoccaceae archaeon]|nr:DNA primase catalytic subunit PriS [Methanomassiliicoccaceae archaeon]